MKPRILKNSVCGGNFTKISNPNQMRMKKLFLILSALAFCFTGMSAGEFKEFVPKNMKEVMQPLPLKKQLREVPEDPEFTVTLNIDFDTRMMRLEDMILIFSEGEFITFHDYSRSDQEIFIPLNKGTYDFVIMLADRYKRMTILTVNDLVVDADKTVSLNVDDATEVITFNPLMPDGEPFAPELCDEDQETVLDKGNAWDVTTFTQFGTRKYGIFFRYMSYEMRFMYEGEECYIGNKEIRALPGNDLFIERVYTSYNEDGGNIIYIPAPELKTAVLTNDVKNYVTFDEEYLPSPFSRPSEYGDGVTPYDKSRGFSAFFWMPGSPDSFGGMGSTVINMDFEKRLLAVCQPKVASRQIWPVLKFNEWDAVTTKSQPIDPLSYKVLGINNLEFNGLGNQYLLNQDGWYPAEEDCINENLSFELGDTPRWGEGVPFAVSLTTDRPSRYSFACTYCGNMGEERHVDIETVEPVIKINGIEATEDQLNAISRNRMPENSVISWEYLNTNITPIDGITPYNRAVTEVSTKSSDRQAPTVQSLRIHDASGKPALSFDNSDEGHLMLYAGDFKCNPLEFDQWYSFNETPAMTIEYRPNGTETFTTLEHKEVPEKFFMPGYGACFTADLDRIGIESANKWYDLRITLKDSAGNSQQQTLSPAFRIEKINDTGIMSNMAETTEFFDVYSSQGILLKKSVTKAQISTLPSGLYIISGRKVLIP